MATCQEERTRSCLEVTGLEGVLCCLQVEEVMTFDLGNMFSQVTEPEGKVVPEETPHWNRSDRKEEDGSFL